MGLGFISHPDKLIYDPPFLIKDQYLYNFVKGPKPFPFSNRLKSLNFGVNVEPKLFEEFSIVNVQDPSEEALH